MNRQMSHYTRFFFEGIPNMVNWTTVISIETLLRLRLEEALSDDLK